MICQDVRVDRRIVLQAQTLVSAGYRVAILARAEAEGPIPKYETDGGIPVTRIRVEGNDPRFRWLRRLVAVAGPRGQAGATNAAKLWGALTTRSTFGNLALPVALRARADVYHAHDLNNLSVAYQAARQRGAKLAYDAHEMFSEMDNRWVRVRRGRWRKIEKRLLPETNLATTVNEFIAEEMAKRYGVPPPEVLYNCPPSPVGIDFDAPRTELRDALGVPEGTRILLYQGWMAEGRGLDELVEGSVPLRGASAVLAMMGYGDYRAHLEALVHEHDLGDVVRFLEPVPQADLVRRCASASAGIIPYRPVDLNNYYSSPNKLFDFIQARTPVLANDLPFLRKVVAGRDIGLVAEMTTPASVGQAILDILGRLADPATVTLWLDNLRQAAAEFNWEHEGEKLLTWYAERIGPPHRQQAAAPRPPTPGN